MSMNSIDDIEVEMKRQGGIEALERLKKYLTWCADQHGTARMKEGLEWAIDAIDTDLSLLESKEESA